jgi:hypothetical protein
MKACGLIEEIFDVLGSFLQGGKQLNNEFIQKNRTAAYIGTKVKLDGHWNLT